MTHLLDIKPRHDFTNHDDGVSHYGPWRIAAADWVRPHPSVDWDWWHEDYDGPGDNRCGSAGSLPDCVQAIHEWEDDQ